MEEPLFKNTSRMDEKEIQEFQSFALKKTMTLYSVIIALVCLGAGIGLYFVSSYLGIAVAVIGLLGAFVLFPYVIKESIKKQNSDVFANKKFLNTFEFFKNDMLVTSEQADVESSKFERNAEEKVNYKDLYKVVVYFPYVFIYINESQSFILNQKGMTKGTVEELLKFLSQNGLKITIKK